jgi:hypothetical protein
VINIEVMYGKPNTPALPYFNTSFENTDRRGIDQLQRNARFRHSSMERWNPGDMDVSGCILRTWMPAIPAGMTHSWIFILCGRA